MKAQISFYVASLTCLVLACRPSLRTDEIFGLSSTLPDPKPQTIAPSLIEIAPDQISSLIPDGDPKALKGSLQRQIVQCSSLNLSETFKFGTQAYTRKEWCLDSAARLIQILDQSSNFSEVISRMKSEFRWFRSTGNPNASNEVRFTGYYFPTLEGSFTKSQKYSTPLLKQPKDLVSVPETQADGSVKNVWRKKLQDGSLVMPPTRADIYSGVLDNQALEIGWVEDPLDLFILQVQGSGALLVKNPDGTTTRQIMNYAAGNGHPYKSIRKILMEQGVDPKFYTLQGIREYFQLFPEKKMDVLAQSPSYVFFQKSKEGPYGAGQVIITPGHSIAVDLTAFPVGAIAFLKTERPEKDASGTISWKEFSRIAIAQDTGGAIKTPGRVDIYWGEDDYAEFAAGQMNQTGDLFFAIAR
jgi:membrane-bound lytic murein transglycosylase A